tara:strand:- start:596 stop:820 length:225 start_codon:yes stop_codon:yes gene_type:complete
MKKATSLVLLAYFKAPNGVCNVLSNAKALFEDKKTISLLIIKVVAFQDSASLSEPCRFKTNEKEECKYFHLSCN